MNPLPASERDADQRFRLPSLTLLSLLVELTLVVLAALMVTRPYMDFSPNMRFSGGEAEVNMSSEYSASIALHTLGYLPLWDPFLKTGEPLITNPTSMILNPLTSWPSLILGAVNGLKVSMILAIIFSGLGGWVLGRLLSFRWPGRLTVGVLCIARGGLHAVLLPGFIQFTMAQAHFSWIMVGAIGILWYRHRRWPLILMPVMLCLMYWVGIPWYVPAIELSLVVLTLVHSVKIQLRASAESIRRPWFGQRKRREVPPGEPILSATNNLVRYWHPRLFIDTKLIGRMVFAGALGIGLSAIVLLPQLAERNNIGVSSIAIDSVYPLTPILDVFFNPELPDGIPDMAFYNFTSPYWYMALLAIGIIAARVFKQSRPSLAYPPMLRWVIIAALALFAFCVLWGDGINPIIEWSYGVIPLANSFRHVERVLTVASFWLVIVIASAVDYLWIRMRTANWNPMPGNTAFLRAIGKGIRMTAALAFIAAGGTATVQVLGKWYDFGIGLTAESANVDECMAWLRSTNGSVPLSVYSADYGDVDAYLKYDIRHFTISEDFYNPSPTASTLYNNDLIDALPQFATTWGDWYLNRLNGLHYGPTPGIPMTLPDFPCFYTRSDYIPYAFIIAKDALVQTADALTPLPMIPISTFKRNYDLVAVVVDGAQADQVLTVQELAYPGWMVQVNGSPANLEVIGGQIGVLLPASATQYQVLFQYRPTAFVVGGYVTLVSWLLCVLFLLKADRFAPQSWRTDKYGLIGRLFKKVMRVMLAPNALSDEIYPPTIFKSENSASVPLLLQTPSESASIYSTRAQIAASDALPLSSAPEGEGSQTRDPEVPLP